MVTFAFALALLAFASAAVAWITLSGLARRYQLLESSLVGTQKHLQTQLAALEQRPANTPVAQLRAEVVDLAASVDELRASMRKQLGKLYRRQQLDEGISTAVGGTDSGDPEIDAMIALQNARPPPPK